jgi:hypothetical protein
LLPNIDVQWFGISEYRSRRREDWDKREFCLRGR